MKIAYKTRNNSIKTVNYQTEEIINKPSIGFGTYGKYKLILQ